MLKTSSSLLPRCSRISETIGKPAEVHYDWWWMMDISQSTIIHQQTPLQPPQTVSHAGKSTDVKPSGPFRDSSNKTGLENGSFRAKRWNS